MAWLEAVVDRAALTRRLQEILARTPNAPRFSGKSEVEIMDEVVDEIDTARS